MKASILYFQIKERRASILRDFWNLLLAKTRRLRFDIIFTTQLNIAVSVLNFFGDRSKCRRLMKEMAGSPDNTLGKALYKIMGENNLELVPWYKEHDLKHALLGYKMEAPDEMRMQCFMWGNAGFSLFTTVITIFFIIWTPEMWPDARHHYRAGKLVKNVTRYRLESSIYLDLSEVRKEIELEKAIAYFESLK